MQVARVLVGIIQVVHFPCTHFAARNATRDLLAQLTGRRLGSAAFNAAETLTFFCAALGLSLVGVVCVALCCPVLPRRAAPPSPRIGSRTLHPPCLHLDSPPLSLLLQLVKDLGQVFSLIGGSCGAFFIFGMPGALLLQYAYSKHLSAQEQQQQQQEGLQQSLLEGGGDGACAGGAGSRYHYLASKLWWAGCGLLGLALGLLALTVFSLTAAAAPPAA